MGSREPEYGAWSGIRRRCLNPNTKDYPRYGGRGISVHPSWVDDYPKFLSDVGPKPTSEHELDRINNDGNYEPGNVRWVLPTVNCRNKSTNNNITAFGTTQCITDWAITLGVSPMAILTRLQRGWSPEDAVSVPRESGHHAHHIIIDGVDHSATDWSNISGTPPQTICSRLKKGWSPKDAVYAPSHTKGLGINIPRILSYDGQTMSVNEWSIKMGLSKNTVSERLHCGWSEEEAITTPKGRTRGTQNVP